MTTVAATEFARNFSLYREAAQREPVAVIAHKRVAGYFMSAHDFDEYQRLKAAQRRALYPKELDEADLRALRDAKTPESARELDHLLG